MISVAFALVKAAFLRGVENPDDIEQIGLSVYASVPKSTLQLALADKLKRKHNKKLALLSDSNPTDLSIEALRGLRTSLHFAMLEAKNNVVMISGPAPGIGKSFISTNFAAMFWSQVGKWPLRLFKWQSDDGTSGNGDSGGKPRYYYPRPDHVKPF